MKFIFDPPLEIIQRRNGIIPVIPFRGVNRTFGSKVQIPQHLYADAAAALPIA